MSPDLYACLNASFHQLTDAVGGLTIPLCLMLSGLFALLTAVLVGANAAQEAGLFDRRKPLSERTILLRPAFDRIPHAMRHAYALVHPGRNA